MHHSSNLSNSVREDSLLTGVSSAHGFPHLELTTSGKQVLPQGSRSAWTFSDWYAAFAESKSFWAAFCAVKHTGHVHVGLGIDTR